MSGHESESYNVPANIEVLLHGGGAIIMDTCVGSYKNISLSDSNALQAVHYLGTVEAAHAVYAGEYPLLSKDYIGILTAHKLNELQGGSLIGRGAPKSERTAFSRVRPYKNWPAEADATIDRPLSYIDQPASSLRLHDRWVALRGLHKAKSLAHGSDTNFGRQIMGLASIRAAASRNATYEEACTALRTVGNSLRWYPGRVACLELTMAAIYYGSKRMDVSIGMQFAAKADPLAAHVYPLADNRRVHLPGDPAASVHFEPIYTI